MTQCKFDKKQYDMLMRCSQKRDMKEWNEWRKKYADDEVFLEGAYFWKANLEGADFTNAHLKKADFWKANLEGADFTGAYLIEADFWKAHLKHASFMNACLKGADLIHANLKGTDFIHAHLEGTRFNFAVVDGETLFSICWVDERTDFHGVGLDNARLSPCLKQFLEYNIRRRNWQEWYKKHRILQWPLRMFWFMSDYGMSSARIAGIFLGFALFFALIYYAWGCLDSPGIISNLFQYHNNGKLTEISTCFVFLRSIYFSVLAMSPFSLGGDMYAQPESFWGHLLLILQIFLGYIIFGAWISRLLILFTTGGPISKFPKKQRR